MPSDCIISLALLTREHHRLHQQANQLRTHTLSLQQLNALRKEWLNHLGFPRYTGSLQSALDRLIEQKEEERIASDEAYGDVLHHIDRYRQRTWQALEQHYADLHRYLDASCQLRPVYAQLFQRTIEAYESLTLSQQATILRRLHPARRCFDVGDKLPDPPRCLSPSRYHQRI